MSFTVKNQTHSGPNSLLRENFYIFNMAINIVVYQLIPTLSASVELNSSPLTFNLCINH